MMFPAYQLADFQITYTPQAKYFLGTAAPEPLAMKDLLLLATKAEQEAWEHLSLGYSPSQGDEGLRETIASQYPGLSAKNIITFSGAQEAIFATYHALLKADDLVSVITPIFEPLLLTAESIGARVHAVQLKTRPNEPWRLSVEQFVQSISPSTQLTAINFPHNPTGAMIKHDELQVIVDRCQQCDSWLFSDEVFRGLEYEDKDRLPTVASLYAKGISLGVMSKAYGLGGLRVGWVACQNRQLIQRLIKIKHQLSVCNGQAEEMLSTIALNHSDEILEKKRVLIASHRALIDQKLPELNKIINWHPSQAGFVALPTLKTGKSRIFTQQLLKNKALMVIPSDCFRSDLEGFRLGFGKPDFPFVLDLFLKGGGSV